MSARTLIVGDVHGCREELEDLTRELGIYGKVQFLGHRTDMSRLLAAMVVVVFPSADPEPVGRRIAEPLAVGIPVIANAIGETPEIIEHGVNGYLFDVGDTHALAKFLDALLSDDDLAKELGKAGKRMAEMRFTQSNYVAEIEAIYDDL